MNVSRQAPLPSNMAVSIESVRRERNSLLSSIDMRSMTSHESFSLESFDESWVSSKSSMRTTSLLTRILEYPSLIYISSCWSKVRPSAGNIGDNTMKRVPTEHCLVQLMISSTLFFLTSWPEIGEIVLPMRANSRRRYSYISVLVPTVERGLRAVTFCSMAMAGGNPFMKSHSGFLTLPKNCLA